MTSEISLPATLRFTRKFSSLRWSCGFPSSPDTLSRTHITYAAHLLNPCELDIYTHTHALVLFDYLLREGLIRTACFPGGDSSLLPSRAASCAVALQCVHAGSSVSWFKHIHLCLADGTGSLSFCCHSFPPLSAWL